MELRCYPRLALEAPDDVGILGEILAQHLDGCGPRELDVEAVVDRAAPAVAEQRQNLVAPDPLRGWVGLLHRGRRLSHCTRHKCTYTVYEYTVRGQQLTSVAETIRQNGLQRHADVPLIGTSVEV